MRAEVINSTLSEMFAKVSLEQVVDKFINKVNKEKEKNGAEWAEGSISIKVSENFKVKIKYVVCSKAYQFDFYIYKKDSDSKYPQWGHRWVNDTPETKLYEKLLDIISEIVRFNNVA